jgi:cytochrome bd-type quinol oxidase subunit 2
LSVIDIVEVVLFYASVIAFPITWVFIDKERSIKSDYYNNMKIAYCVFTAGSLLFGPFVIYLRLTDSENIPDWFVLPFVVVIVSVIGLFVLEFVHFWMWMANA